MSVDPVLIAGGGPVGMTIALELAHHGVPCVLFERNQGTTRHPKMDFTNARSMELFGRLGLTSALRKVGVPETSPFDIVWATSPSGTLIHRFPYRSVNDWREKSRRENDGSFPQEPPMRISQIILEPVLKQLLDASLVDVRFGWKVESFSQDDGSVEVVASNVVTGEGSTTRGTYLVGADGGGSRVRRQLGIGLEGIDSVGRVYMIHFRSTARDVLAPWGIVHHLQTPRGTLVAQDDVDTWTLHVLLTDDDDDDENLDPADLLRKWAGMDFDFEILVANPWSPRVLLAHQYRDGRVFLAGDSAHQVIPTGGYGMNTGIGDAVDLGWKLAAVHHGWGGPELLDSYEAERRPIATENTAGCLRHAEVRNVIGQYYEEAALKSCATSEERVKAEGELGAKIAAIGNHENESYGLEYGYRYGTSPVVSYCDMDREPVIDPVTYHPNTNPGARLPHVFLKDGSSLYDHLGREFTLIQARHVEVADWSKAAADLGIPLHIFSYDDDHVLNILERRMLLIRPDQHVAWRGNASPTDPKAILLRAAGRRPDREIDVAPGS